MQGAAPPTSIDPAVIDALAEVVADKVAARLPQEAAEDGWMTSEEAASYLAVPISTLRKLTAAGSIPFSQDVPGGRCYFKRAELDRWRTENASGLAPARRTQRGKMRSTEQPQSGPATLQRPGPWPKEVQLHEQGSD